MDEVTLKQLIKSLDKQATNINVVQTGTANVIGISGDKVFRFPHDKSAQKKLIYEAEILKTINDRLDVQTPKVLSMHADPQCIIETRVSGKHFSVKELAGLTDDQLRAFVQKILGFNGDLNNVTNTHEVKQLEVMCLGDEVFKRSWPTYLKDMLIDENFSNSKVKRLAKEQYEAWLQMRDNSTLPYIVIHDDLQSENLMFVRNKLSGVIDFGDCTVGTIAQELRQLLRISKKAVLMAIEEYESMTTIKIDYDEIKTWAVTYELAVYCRHSAKKDFDNPWYKRSKSNLNKWLPEFRKIT